MAPAHDLYGLSHYLSNRNERHAAHFHPRRALLLAIGLFVSPILFVPVLVPPGLDTAFYFNPFSYVIWPHKDLMFYGHLEHPYGWLGLIGFNILFIWGGVRTFQRLRPRFGDVL